MTKLTVAEASKRGYASGLSILQAVQKDWLKAEKGHDGQLHVDTGDLEKLFGRPEGSEQGSIETPLPLPDTDDRAVAEAQNPVPADDIEDFDALDDPGTQDDGDTPSQPQSPATAVHDGTGDRDSEAPAVPGAPQPEHRPAETDDSAALRAEITSLRNALATEKRRTAALVDVLATRVLAPENHAPVSPSDAEIAPDDGGDLSARIDVQPAAGTVDAAAGIAQPAQETDAGTDRPEADQSGPASPPPSEPHQEIDEDPADNDDIAMPALAANPAERHLAPAASPSRFEAETAERDRALFWQVWGLVSFVWIGLIGAILWYIGGLGDDLWTVAEWIRGERTGDSPTFIDASSASLRAARDIFVPPLALLVLMLICRQAFRALRRR